MLAAPSPPQLTRQEGATPICLPSWCLKKQEGEAERWRRSLRHRSFPPRLEPDEVLIYGSQHQRNHQQEPFQGFLGLLLILSTFLRAPNAPHVTSW